MPNSKSAIKRVRRVKAQTAVNTIRMSKYRSALKKIYQLIGANKKKEAKKFLPELNSQIIRAAKTGVIKRKAASRKVSRVMKKINNLK